MAKAKTDKTNEQNDNVCFVVGPIGPDDSDIRRQADWTLNGLIRPVAESLGYSVVRADEISSPGMINSQVINQVQNAALVIADLSGGNPNAFYEIGIRHMSGKPTIHVVAEADSIPFDVGAYRTIRFDASDYHKFEESKNRLYEQISHVQENPSDVDNPVITANAKLQAYKDADDDRKYILEVLEEIRSRVDRLERTQKTFSDDTVSRKLTISDLVKGLNPEMDLDAMASGLGTKERERARNIIAHGFAFPDDNRDPE